MEQDRTAKPLTTKFVKRAPRLTKPLELKKHPRPRQRHIQRQMVSVKAKARREDLASFAQAVHVAESFARPAVSVGRPVLFGAGSAEPQLVADVIEGTIEAQQRIDMALEMVDIDALDTGEYQAMVVQDPHDKRNVKGFFHMARLRSPVIDFVSTPESVVWTEWMRTNSMFRIAEAVNRYTSIRADYRDTFTPDDRKLLKVPMVFLMPISRFELTNSESLNLGDYLTSGGFLFGDWGHRQVIESLYQVVERALTAKDIGPTEWQSVVLPDKHPLFHCFFDFDGAPPGGVDYFNRAYPEDGCVPSPVVRGIVLHGRLTAIVSEKWYTYVWGAFGLRPSKRWTTRPYETLDPTRPLQFAVNLVVFALTQEGSITHRLMESVQ
jgi:hypothetical protein